MIAAHGLLLIDNTGEGLLEHLGELTPNPHLISIGEPIQPADASPSTVLAMESLGGVGNLPTWRLSASRTDSAPWVRTWQERVTIGLNAMREERINSYGPDDAVAAEYAALRDRINAHRIYYNRNTNLYIDRRTNRMLPALALGGHAPSVSGGTWASSFAATLVHSIQEKVRRAGLPTWLNGRGLLVDAVDPSATHLPEAVGRMFDDAKAAGMYSLVISAARLYNRRGGQLPFRSTVVNYETGMASSAAMSFADHALLLEGAADLPPFGGYIGDDGALVRIPSGLASSSPYYEDVVEAILDALWQRKKLTRRRMLTRINDWLEAYNANTMERTVTEWAIARERNEEEDLLTEIDRQLRDQDQNLQRARQLARSAKALSDRLDAHRAGVSSAMDRVTRDIASLKKYMERGRLTAVESVGNTLTVTTSPLFVQDDRSGAWHALGPMKIIINMATTALRFKRANNTGVSAYQQTMQAPHVFSDGRACPGNFNELQVDLFMAGDWMSLIDAGMAFLESVNTQDSAGRYVHRWPFVADPEAHGLPPYEEGFMGPWTDAGAPVGPPRVAPRVTTEDTNALYAALFVADERPAERPDDDGDDDDDYANYIDDDDDDDDDEG